MGPNARLAMQDQRALLDELMGKQRDIPEAERREIKFDDREIDKFWLCGLQPFDLFKNTPWATRLPDVYRRALGREYTGEETDQPRSVLPQWEQVPEAARQKYGYEWELYLFIDELVRANERAVQRARQQHESKACEITDVEAERLAKVEAEMASLQKAAEAAGENGDVDASLSLMAKVDQLTKQKEAIIKPTDQRIQKVLVCEVSGNVVQNTEVRIQEHYQGRIYLSWKATRDKLAELKAKYAGKPPPRLIPHYDYRRDRSLLRGDGDAAAADARRGGGDDDDRDARGRRRERDDYYESASSARRGSYSSSSSRRDHHYRERSRERDDRERYHHRGNQRENYRHRSRSPREEAWLQGGSTTYRYSEDRGGYYDRVDRGYEYDDDRDRSRHRHHSSRR